MPLGLIPVASCCLSVVLFPIRHPVLNPVPLDEVRERSPLVGSHSGRSPRTPVVVKLLGRTVVSSSEGLSSRVGAVGYVVRAKIGEVLRVSDALVDSPEFRIGKKVSEHI